MLNLVEIIERPTDHHKPFNCLTTKFTEIMVAYIFNS